MTLLVLLLLVGAGLLIARSVSQNRQRQALEERRVADLDAVRKVADEDVTRFGEELQRLDADLLTETLDEPTRQDYQRALDSYESAKDSMTRLTRSEDVRHVTEQLEDGRYAVACVRARVAKEPLPTRRPPCFFNPAHGPSTTDIEWAPPGGQAAPGPGLRGRRRPGGPGRRARRPHGAAGRRPGAVLAGRAGVLPLGGRLLRRLRRLRPGAGHPARLADGLVVGQRLRRRVRRGRGLRRRW